MTTLETEARSGYLAEMHQDTDAPDPREWMDGATFEAVEMWKEGDVYEYAITDVLTGEIVASLSGMYGYAYAAETMRDALDEQIGEPSAMAEAVRALEAYAAELTEAGKGERSSYVEDLAERVAYVWG